LISDLDEKTSHALISVVVAGNSVDHFNRVHKCRQCFLDSLGSSLIQWLNEFFESLQVFYIVFSFIQSLSNSKLNASPLAGSKM